MDTIAPKKALGQHFLVQESVAERIAKSLQRATECNGRVLEIGPGKGMLTKYLLAAGFSLTVVETDRDMVAYLAEYYPQLEPKSVIQADFLRLRLEQHYAPDAPFCIIGNFPYNISSQIVFKMLDYRHLVPELVGMFQKEMAERVVAKPGGKDYGVISVLTQAYYSGEYLFSVSRGNFNPPPNVESGVIRLTRRDDYVLPCNERLFKTIVKTAFGQRRKMLRNTLKSLLIDANDEAILHDPIFTERPEQLSVSDFVRLTVMLDMKRD